MLPAEPPENPEKFEACIADLDTIVAPNLSHWQHPRFFGYFPANAMMAGVLGDLVSTGLGHLGSVLAILAGAQRNRGGRHGLGAQDGRPFVRMGRRHQRHSLHQHARRDDLQRASGRPITGSRKAVSRPKPSRSWSTLPQAAIRASRRGRFSPASGARTSGWFRSTKRRECGRTALSELIERDLAAGLRPCAIAAVVGGTATASLDPIRAIADIARRYGLWLHVDAAMAGSAMILPECRWMWDGIESADSS